jgi:hypothetical protein
MTGTEKLLLLLGVGSAVAAVIYWRRSAPTATAAGSPSLFEQMIATHKMCMGKDGINRPCGDGAAAILLAGVIS